MNVGVLLRPSRATDEHDPGHMGLYWNHVNNLQFRGYYFHVADLPEYYQDPARWRDYLFNHKVSGYIHNDIRLRDDYEKRRSLLLSKAWMIDDVGLNKLQVTASPRPIGWYSFNPDDFDCCHNCVTWAIETMNLFIENALQRVRQGRIKEMQTQLRQESQ